MISDLLPRIQTKWRGYTRQTSIEKQVSVLIGLVFFAALLFIFTVIFLFIYATEEAAWQGRQTEAAQNAAQTVSGFIEVARHDLELIGKVEPAYLQARTGLLDEMLADNRALLEVVRVDQEGKVVASASRGRSILKNEFTIPQSQWFQSARQGRAYQGNLMLSFANEPYLVIALPASNSDVVAARLRMYVLQDVVNQIHFGRSGRAYVITEDGTVIAHTYSKVSRQGTSIVDRPEYRAILAAPDRQWNGRYVNLEGNEVVAVSAQVGASQPENEWIVVTELPAAEAYAASWRAAVVLFAGLGSIFAVVVLITRHKFRQVVFYPLELLRMGVERIGQGDLEHRIDELAPNEMDQVATAINDMAARLRDRQRTLTQRSAELAQEAAERQKIARELQALNEELEHRVAERTDELVHEIDERKHMEADLRKSLKRITLLNRVISAGTTGLEPHKIFEVLCRETAEALDVPQALFALFDESGQNATVMAEYALEGRPAAAGTVLPVRGDAVIEYVVSHRQPLVINDAQNDPRYPALNQFSRKRDVLAMMVVPLVLRQKVIGLLALEATTCREFMPDEVEMTQTVTTAAGQVFENARLYAEIQHELAERRQVEARLLYQSTHDSLTDLHNRLFFEEQVRDLERVRTRPVSFIMMDLDQLKVINDNLGHAVGDEYLQHLAGVLKSVFRSEDVVARLGGDEFVVILKGCGSQAAESAVQRLRSTLAERSYRLPAGPLRVSIGTATSYDEELLTETFKQADHKMYAEKLERREQNRWMQIG